MIMGEGRERGLVKVFIRLGRLRQSLWAEKGKKRGTGADMTVFMTGTGAFMTVFLGQGKLECTITVNK